MLIAALMLAAVAINAARGNERFAIRMDRWTLELPLFGNWLRDMAVLQLMEVLGNLMAAGFTLADALGECADSVGNRAVRQNVLSLQKAVLRGERFSREIEGYGDMFPPIVSQLVIVGEQTGTLAHATAHIRDHLRREIERKTSLLVGTIEPLLDHFVGDRDRCDPLGNLLADVRHGQHGGCLISKGESNELDQNGPTRVARILTRRDPRGRDDSWDRDGAVVTRISGSTGAADRNACFVNQGDIEIQVQIWHRQHGAWPSSNLSQIGADADYFPQGLPKCPVDASAYTIDSTGHVMGHTH